MESPKEMLPGSYADDWRLQRQFIMLIIMYLTMRLLSSPSSPLDPNKKAPARRLPNGGERK
jgi:hypothetical protein